jgi:hypothetical protein
LFRTPRFSVTASAMADTGPSTATAPYVQPMIPGLKVKSILTTGGAVGASGYRMGGIPDGLGAYDNGDRTFTLLMNHELGKDLGLTRAHGGKGSQVPAPGRQRIGHDSGVIDVTEILGRKDGRRYKLFVVQVHAEVSDPRAGRGGQPLPMSQPSGDRKGKRGDDDGRSGSDHR